MPTSNVFHGAQLVTFAIALAPNNAGTLLVKAKRNQSPASLAAAYGQPQDALLIGQLNHVHAFYKFAEGRQVKLPASYRGGAAFSVMADDATAPTVTAGYSKLQVIPRPAMIGIGQFQGYDPMAMEIAIRFEAADQRDGSDVEQGISTLERMAGRGLFAGAGFGAPPILRISTTDNLGNVVPLVPLNFQWSTAGAVLRGWRIADIRWDQKPWRNALGRRIRQTAVVTVWQYVPIHLQASLAQRTQQNAA
jgi:hypothetical protein